MSFLRVIKVYFLCDGLNCKKRVLLPAGMNAYKGRTYVTNHGFTSLGHLNYCDACLPDGVRDKTASKVIRALRKEEAHAAWNKCGRDPKVTIYDIQSAIDSGNFDPSEPTIGAPKPKCECGQKCNCICHFKYMPWYMVSSFHTAVCCGEGSYAHTNLCGKGGK